MQSLVYDFGQLSSDTETEYAEKIVEKFVCNIKLSNLRHLYYLCIQEEDIPDLDVDLVTNVLMACQNYMRMRTVTSFICMLVTY